MSSWFDRQVGFEVGSLIFWCLFTAKDSLGSLLSQGFHFLVLFWWIRYPTFRSDDSDSYRRRICIFRCPRVSFGTFPREELKLQFRISLNSFVECFEERRHNYAVFLALISPEEWYLASLCLRNISRSCFISFTQEIIQKDQVGMYIMD